MSEAPDIEGASRIYDRAHQLDWSTYAHQYDAVCERNPSYQDNVNVLLAHLEQMSLAEDATICDLGAGTGNFIAAMAKCLPNAHFTHIDRDNEMNKLARRKYDHLNLKVDLIENHIQRVVVPNGSLDLIVCVNCLYAVPPQLQILEKVSTWLKPDGHLFIIDFGRKMRIVDWNLYILRNSLKNSGFINTYHFFRKNWEFSRQNQKAALDQDAGRFWLHTTNEFGDLLRQAGFVPFTLKPCYRGYSDLAICRLA